MPSQHPSEHQRSRRRYILLAGAMAAAIVALYVLLPRVAGLDATWGRLRDGDAAWISLAGLLEVGSYADTCSCCGP